MSARSLHEDAAARHGAFWSAFGPGLLWAAAAIGVSHLVQSTRAGADAGLGLAWIVLAALILKYPFFEYGPRYAAATGESLVEGYRRLGRWALWLYVAITVSTALAIDVVIILFTSFLVRFALGLDWSLFAMALVVTGGCVLLLAVGRYKALDAASKLILAVLAVSTLLAAALALPRALALPPAPWPLSDHAVSFTFILALMGWMPSAIDVAVWSSLWTLAKNRASGTRASVAHALLDFRIGYVGTGILAFAFLVLGAGVMHGSGERFAAQGTAFSAQLVELYTRLLGGWLGPVVTVAVVTTMLSTAVTVVDGFPRAIARSARVLRGRAPAAAGDEDRVYWGTLALLAFLTLVVIARFAGTLTTLVDLVTVISFGTAPILGYLNLRVVTGPHMPADGRPGRGLLGLSWLGLLLLGGTAVAYLIDLLP